MAYRKRRAPVYKRRKKTMYRKKRKGVINSKNRDLMIYRPYNNNPFPQRLRTNFICEGTYALSNVLYTNKIIDVKMNSMFLPFNVATSGTGAIVYGGPLTVATLYPTGMSALIQSTGNPAPYTSYRVYGSSIEVNLLPDSTGDIMQCVVLPYAVNHAGVTDDIFHCQSLPFAKSQFCNASFIQANKIKNYITPAQYFGLDPKALLYDVSQTTATPLTDPLNLIYWRVIFNNPDNIANNSQGSIRIKVKYYTELFWQSEQNLPFTV